MILNVERVSYGQKGMHPKDREYRIIGIADSPVGTINEIKEWIKTTGLFISAIHIRDRIEGEEKEIDLMEDLIG